VKRQLLLPVLLCLHGCGHLASYTETPLDYAELYKGIEHPFQLRVFISVQVHDFPPRSYVASEWISLDDSGAELLADTSENGCPEGTKTFRSAYRTRGAVTLGATVVQVSLEQLKWSPPGVTEWQPYRFNGTYRLVRVEVPLSAASNVSKDCTPVTE
jgi:hypothetical protein